MTTKVKTASKPVKAAPGQGSNGNGRAKSNGNGKPRANGTPRINGKPRQNGNGNGAAGAAEARRVATEIGNAVLVATSIETARHSDDVELIAGAICESLDLSELSRDEVLASARLHDIGKTAIPHAVLAKQGPLDSAEWELMRQHTIVGQQILASVAELEGIARLVRHSHERWDGDGYPDGLAGEEIPLGSRIIFCADAFHAVRSDRPYRKGKTANQALAEVKRCAGTQFDPRVVSALEDVVHELRIVGPPRRTHRSSRLTALLLVLALGGGGSAIARTNLLGEPGPAAPSAAAQAAVADPFASSLFGASLLEQMQALGLSGPAQVLVPPGPGDNRGGDSVAGGDGTQSGGGGAGSSAGGDATAPESSGTDQGQGGSSNQGHSNAGGNGNANGHGNGNANGQQNGNGNGGGSGSSPGNSGNAPGHSESGPGNSGNAPGHSGSAPGNSGNAPGHSGSAPGNSGNAPGHSGSGPGNSGNAPGHS